MGWTIDYGDVKARFKEPYEELDHHELHSIPSIRDSDNPAAVLSWIRSQVCNRLPQLDRIDLFEDRHRGASLVWGNAQDSLSLAL